MTDRFTSTLPAAALAVILALTPVLVAAQEATPPAPAPQAHDFPKWSEFPPPPKDVPTAAEIKTRVLEMQGVGISVQKTIDAIVWDLDQQPQAFITKANARIDPILGAPAKPMDMGELNAFVNKLRVRATPPSVAN
ncbi:hypothetical protein [Asticcacaulis sp. YBE204]|uniref:hypothetical protein n=1 Tax=Asticcacaulis sp. YBE204 TaxID=1282363 RepID=UPI0003C3E1F4|nr:hypothetical protein [Asticcacaulis sp. YBE204]ESQ77047.1 hypothetical protein AEYBE204_18350 [Asticcacaulis sp. YBE204]